jgi:hypothetical protein
MALKKIGKKPLFTKSGIEYYAFYDPFTGDSVVQVENPSTADNPVMVDGKWNKYADEVGLTDEEKGVYWETTKQQIDSAYKVTGTNTKTGQGGTGGVAAAQAAEEAKKKKILPQWVKNGTNPNQTTLTPTQPTIGVGKNPGLGSGENLGQIISDSKSQYATYKQFGKGVGAQKMFDGAMYPIDMDIQNQDHCIITANAYRPAFADDLFENKNVLASGGLQSKGNKYKRLSTIYLPMPAGIQDANSVNWEGDQLGALAADAMNGINIGTMLTQGAAALAGQGGAAGSIIDLAGKVIRGSGSQEFKELAGAAVQSKVLNMQGYAVSPETILSRKSGIIPNNNNELLFKGVTMRSFSFTHKMSARSAAEADQIRKIIRFFKFNMAAKKRAPGSSGTSGLQKGGASFFLGTPDIFEMKFMTNIGGKPVENPSIGMMKPMALKTFGCNYTPDGLWAAYTDGQPVQVVIQTTFQELEPIFDSDYIGANDGDNKNLRHVPDNAVGW